MLSFGKDFFEWVRLMYRILNDSDYEIHIAEWTRWEILKLCLHNIICIQCKDDSDKNIQIVIVLLVINDWNIQIVNDLDQNIPNVNDWRLKLNCKWFRLRYPHCMIQIKMFIFSTIKIKLSSF